MSASRALRLLGEALAVLPSDTPVSAGLLVEKLGEAERAAESWEYDEYMGEDM